MHTYTHMQALAERGSVLDLVYVQIYSYSAATGPHAISCVLHATVFTCSTEIVKQ